ncbi:transglutaminase domain-containing protein [Candidatus Woesearchaeota archaeon]|nr:transglutaminase domain-containing protein [Candidatus Woesearchaeota archaeon]
MKKRLCILTILLILFSSPALALWYYDSSSVTVDIRISSGLDITRPPNSLLDYVTANVSFAPQDSESQSVLSIDAVPEPYSTDGDVAFRWDDPVPNNPGFEITTRVKTKSIFHDVPEIRFPYLGFPDDAAQYLLPGEIIDSNNSKVIEKASELAAGEDDYYEVVFKFADWTKENVEYDLSTLNTKASQKASYVLARKDGVCDEITTLFIAMLRAVGIPARFISGIAYTESDKFPQNWGAHGWAEVYFPGTGWVPFDVTYGQYGFVDPTHVKLKEALDAGESDTRYEWLGKDVKVSANPIIVSADLVDKQGFVPGNVELSLDMLQKQVGIGSYNLVEATVKNKKDSYVSSFIYLARINELEVEGNNYQSIMLKPLETKKFYWVVKVIESLDSHFTYTFPMSIADVRNNTADADFQVIPGATVFSMQDMEQVVDAAIKEEEKVYSKKIEIDCAQEEEFYYVYDDPNIECTAANTGNFPFKDLQFCFRDECRTADLGISQQKAFPYTVHSPKPGINKIPFTREGKDVSRSFFYDLDVYDEPSIVIDDIEYPAQIEFKQPYVVAFTLKKKSSSIPQDIVITFDAAGNEKQIEIKALTVDKKLLFNLNSQDLSTKPNAFIISVNYKDLNEKIYTEKEEFDIGLVNVKFSQRMVIFIHDLDRWLRNLFK